MKTSQRNSLRKFVIALLTGALVALGIGLTSVPAMADDPPPPPPPKGSSVTIPVGNGDATVPPKTSPPPKTNPGTNPPPPPKNDDTPGGGGAPKNAHIEYATRVIDYRNNDRSWAYNQAVAQCPPSEETVGARVSYQFTYSDDLQAIVLGTTRLNGVSCLSLTTWNTTMRCYVDVQASLSMAQPTSKTILGGISSSTPWGNGDQTVSGCNASQSVYLSMNVDVSEYGRYIAPSYVRYQNITVKHWSENPIDGSTRPPEIIAISGVSNTSTRAMYAQLTCAGGNVGANQASVWTGSWTWHETDCGPDNPNNNPVTYQCTAKGTPLLNNQAAATATITHSGDANPLSWDVPVIVGNTSGPIITEATKVDRSGTPWRTTASVKENDVELWRTGQNKLVNSEGTGWMPGSLNSGWEFRSTWASEAGKPTVLVPSFRYNANWVKSIMVITGMNPFTGEATVSYRTTTVNADAVCVGAPISITVARTVNS